MKDRLLRDMRQKISHLFLSMLTPVCLGFIPAAYSEPISVVPGEYIVQRRSSVTEKGYSALSIHYTQKHSFRSFDLVVPHSASRRLAGLSVSREDLDWSIVARDCAEIRRDTSVITCEPNVIRKLQVLPNDPNFGSQWALHDPVHDADVNAPLAWDKGTGTKQTLVGIIDSGIYASHPELAENLWSNPGEVVDGIDNDGNGYVDDIYGVSTYTGSASFTDCNGHGTHVAGIIGARGNNSTAIAGVNWTTSLIAVNTDKDCNGSASVSSVIAAYDYFYDLKRNRGQNIRVLNASFGGDGAIAAEFEAIKRLNSVDILLVAAAGNDAKNIDSQPSYPASYDLPNIVTVGATGPTLELAYYSNFGSSVDIAAPGGDAHFTGGRILSTYSPDADGGAFYALLQGTSMATPMVTGALALIASQREALSGANLRQLLLSSARSVSALQEVIPSGRFLDVGAMSAAADPTDNCPNDPKKFDPGVCGCGVTESYADSDDDGTMDCVDGCPVDARKTSPGACGCGIPEGDINGDGQSECGPVLAGVVPGRPKISVSGSKLVITMQTRSDIDFLVEVTTTKTSSGRNRTTVSRVSLYSSQQRVLRIKKPSQGQTVTVRYLYRTLVDPSATSPWSPTSKLRIS